MKHKLLPANSVIIRFVAFFLVVLVLPASLVMAITSRRLLDMEKTSAHQYLSSNLRTVSSTVDAVLQNLEFAHVSMFLDNHFINNLAKLSPYDNREEYSDYQRTKTIKSGIAEAAVANKYIHSVYAYSFNAERFFSTRHNWDPDFNHFSAQDSEWLSAYLDSQPTQPWTVTTAVKEPAAILSNYRVVHNYGDNMPVAVLSVNLHSSRVTDMLREVNIDKGGYTFVMDQQGKTLGLGPSEANEIQEIILRQIPEIQKEGYLSFRYHNKNLFASYYTSQYSGLMYVAATEINQIQTSVPLMRWMILLFLLLFCVIVLLVLVLARYHFHKPINVLFNGMKQVQQGDFDVVLPDDSSYEFGFINRNFNAMARNIQKLIDENYAVQLVNKEAQLRNIQNQLNEHFLYNTLDSIHWLARIEKAPEASAMVFALANFYRTSLSAGNESIPIRDVLDMLENYLYIQKIRMRDALQYNLHCDTQYLDQPILKNLLQPLVENAIFHGLKGLGRPGFIEVMFEPEDGWMRVSVSDDGNGFSPEKLDEVRTQLKLPNPYCEHSFALKTVQSQFQIYYGIQNLLQIQTAPGEGTTIWFLLPVSGKGEDPC